MYVYVYIQTYTNTIGIYTVAYIYNVYVTMTPQNPSSPWTPPGVKVIPNLFEHCLSMQLKICLSVSWSKLHSVHIKIPFWKVSLTNQHPWVEYISQTNCLRYGPPILFRNQSMKNSRPFNPDICASTPFVLFCFVSLVILPSLTLTFLPRSHVFFEHRSGPPPRLSRACCPWSWTGQLG